MLCYSEKTYSDQKHLYGTNGYTITRTKRGTQKLANKQLLEFYPEIELERKAPSQIGRQTTKELG